MKLRTGKQSSAEISGPSGWIVGSSIGGAVVAVVVVLVSAILAYARSIGDEAPKINAAQAINAITAANTAWPTREPAAAVSSPTPITGRLLPRYSAIR